MAGLFGLLDVGRSALLAEQLGTMVTSHNIANVNTDGYTRRNLVLSPGDPVEIRGKLIGSGVKEESIRSQRSKLIEQELLKNRADLGKDSARTSMLPYLESAIAPQEGGGIEDGLSNFFAAWQDLSAQPQSTAARGQVLTSGKVLASRISNVFNELADQRRAISKDVESLAGEINDLTAQIARLNPEVEKAKLSTGDPGDIRDQRDRLLNDLAGKIEIKTFEDDNGVVEVYTAGGRALVTQNHSAVMTVTPSASDPYGATIELAMDNGKKHDITDSLGGGEMAGLMSASTDISVYMDRLDDFAFQLTNRVNTIHSAGYGLDGTGGRNFFRAPPDPLNPGGAASAMSISPDVDGQTDNVAAATDPSSLPGDNRNALAMGALNDIETGEFSQIVGDIGLTISDAESDETFHQGTFDQTKAFRDSISGVSLEEEMVNMIKYQQAFAAAAKVIQTADELFDSLLSMKR
ncbi:MAG: flagellar hook-associated protein FlgK [Deltaproteobacteria bacterium]|nr:flagellar hook-associated protein FlgK [Deltaproteobacteria bacterium]